MYFEQNISGPIFISDAPDVVISSANSDTIHVVITVDDSSWDMDLCPSVQEDSFKAVIKLKDVLSSVAGKPDFLGEASSVVPKISINADNGTEPAILMEFQAFYGNADGKIPSELKRHWLSWREQISITMRDAREFLTFASGLKLLGWSSGTYSAKAKLFVHGSDPVETTIAEGTLEDDCKYFKLDYSSAKLCESAGVDITRLMAIDCYFVLDGKDSGGTNAHLASYPLRLIISGANDSRLKEFIFCNSLGVEDRVISFGINARSVKGESRVFTSDGTSHEIDNSGIESFQVRSGNISSARGAALWSDFLKASGRYLTSGGKVTEIIVEEWDTDITEGELGNVSFKYHLSRTDRGRWFEDSESLGNYDPLEKFGALSVAGPEVATPPSEDLFFLKTRLDEFPLVELGDDFLFLVQSKSSYSWNSASLKSLKDWLLENISVEALQLWCGPWDNYSEAVSKYALSAGAGKNLYDLIAILNRVCQNNFNSLTNKILAETSARKTADSNLQTGINNVNSLIPSVASTTNQLADKEFVNSSIASSTATFRGTFETINDLPTSSVKKNDYAFVIAVSNGNPEYQRYKYNGEAWAFEYTLNNSSFTSKQWAAITSGITTDKVSSYDTHIFNNGNPHGVTKAQVGLGSVENVALSTWKGSTNITTLGVITTGTWQGTKIANAYLANSSITIGTTKFNLGDAKTAIEGLTSLLFSGASGALTYNKTDKYYSLADNLVVNGILASGTSGTGGADGYSQVEWADIQKMTGSVSGSLASAYAVKESYSALNTIVSKKADKITLDAVTKKVISLENKYTAVTTDIANHIGNTTVHITSAERTAWNNKQAAISDLATIRSNAATAYDWGDHSKAGYVTDNDVAAKYLKLAGGTISGWLIINASTLPISELTTYGITSNNTWNSAQNVNLLLRSANNAMTISLGGQENERKGIIQVGHSAQSYAKVLGDLYLNKFGGNVYIGENIAYHAGNANKRDVNWSCSTMSSMAIGSPYSDVFDANNPDRWINSNYGSANKDYSNMPSGWEYGTVLTIGQQNYRGINGVLNAQFVWDVQSGKDANHPGRLWWRTKNENTGWKNWQELLHTGNFIDGVNYISPKTTLKGYGIEDWVIKYTEASPETLQTAGIYRVSTTGVIGEGYNFPYGQVLVLRGGPGSDTITQIAAPYNKSNLYFRSGTLSNFTDASHPWRTIFNSGNCNLPTVPWTCSSLTATNDVTAKAGLYGQYLEFTSIGSSAGHGGFIDFHFNGNTADYTSRIIEDASGQITIKAGVLNIGTSAKGFLYMLRPSSNYIWANTAGGEICIGTADGGETSALNSGITIIGKRVYIGGTNSGSNALNVKGAIHATTGLYTDGYISAKQASTSSDRRLKKDFCKIDNALKYVLKTHYTRFRWKDDNKESIGIIAQEEQNREYGFLVQNNEKIGHLTYDYAASTALLGAAIQEEDSKVEKLKKRVAELEKELSNLKRKWQH